MTKEELDQILKRKGYSIEDSNSRIRTAKQEQPKRLPLVRPTQRKEKSNSLPIKRTKITFNIWAVRPLDWDNYYIKYVQDLLVEIGALHSDKWDRLQGQVISHKANKKEEERTEVDIEEI